MDKIQFGNSGLKLSKIGLGLAALGRPGYINLGHREDLNEDYDEAKMMGYTHEMLDAAKASGVNYFDAAQSYGKAESFLSAWLTKQKGKEINVGSKWGYYYTAGWSIEADKHEIKDHTIGRLNQQWPESKDRLDPYLKLYQIHSATFESGALENSEVLNRLAEIKSEGYLIGLSLSGPNQSDVLERALETSVNDRPLFDSVQATYNLLEPAAEFSLRRAMDKGLGVIIKEGVANGRLTSRNGNSPYVLVLKTLANKYAVGVDAISLAYILNKAVGHVVLSGAATIEHLKSNLKATQIELTPAELKALDALRMQSANYWKERGNMAWN